MGRKHEIVTIEAEGRDKGKRFWVEELPAYKADRWMQKMGFTVSKDARGDAIPVAFEEYMKTQDEMWQYIYAIPKGMTEAQKVQLCPDVLDGYIEELSTISLLREKVQKLTFGFLGKGGVPK